CSVIVFFINSYKINENKDIHFKVHKFEKSREIYLNYVSKRGVESAENVILVNSTSILDTL
ncbi:TPA: hypothetical protein ACMVEK_003328, partial [Clostridioides difficile]